MLFDKSGKNVPGKRKTSKLEDRFATAWAALGGPELVREYRFDKTSSRRVRTGRSVAFCCHNPDEYLFCLDRGTGPAIMRLQLETVADASLTIIPERP